MTLGELRTRFQGLLNRTDCSNDDAVGFIVLGLQRIQRECRLPCMERTLIYDGTTSTEVVSIPDDMLEPIDLMVQNDGRNPTVEVGDLYPLYKTSFANLQRQPKASVPTYYCRRQAQMWIRGVVPQGNEVHLLYYGGFTAFDDASSENEATAAVPDLCLYAALAYAGDHFGHPQAERWAATYAGMRDAANDAAKAVDEMGGPSGVLPAYET